MSIFSELLPKINEISNTYEKHFEEDLKDALHALHTFEDEIQHGRSRAREKGQKSNAMKALQSINEDEGQPKKEAELRPKRESKKNSGSSDQSSSESTERRASKKRGKNEVDGICSPEQDKRQKRNASVKAQSIISKQVNVNLTQKLRRENTADKVDNDQSGQPNRARQRKDDEKENFQPIVLLDAQIKQEKMSIQPEPVPMDTESNVEIKQEVIMDVIAMPPPQAPIPKPRKGAPKDKPQTEESSEEEPSSRRRTTRHRKQTDTAPQPVPATRAMRSNSRVIPDTEDPSPAPEPEPPSERPKRIRGRKKASETPAPPELASQSSQESLSDPSHPAEPPSERPKRTRGRKKASEAIAEPELVTQSSQESLPASPTDKPRPKRTRRAQRAADKEEQAKTIEPELTQISTKAEPLSPILTRKEIKPKNKKEKAYPDVELTKTKEKELPCTEKELTKPKNTEKELTNPKNTEELTKPKVTEKELIKTKGTEKELPKVTEKALTKTKNAGKELTKTKVIEKDDRVLDETRVITKSGEMDETVVLPNGMYNHVPMTPKDVRNVNETVVLESCSRETFVLDKPQNAIIMDATVILDKGPKVKNISEDNSLLTDDSDEQPDESYTPPKKGIQQMQPTSAVKEKVQQFEELASRVTRTKTRAMAKKDEQPNEDNHTPPDKISKAVLSSETLSKMNNLIFNGKPTQQISSSASKPRANFVSTTKSAIPSSTSKISAINKAKEAAEETLRREDARKKKEALLEAKREQQKRKREEKMAAAAAVRNAAERERQAALEAAVKERMEKQAHADQGKMERLKEAERKKQELARKVAETEERRKAEETARQQRLAEEQRRALAQRQKQIEEHEAMKREAAKMAKEIEQKQREYMEKQKKQRLEDKTHTPFKIPGAVLGTPMGTPRHVEPVYMEDGFQYFVSDEDEEPPPRPVPDWWKSKARRQQMFHVQSCVSKACIDRVFRVRKHTPDLRDIFPNIERARLKRTSSAVWRTPDRLPPLQE